MARILLILLFTISQSALSKDLVMGVGEGQLKLNPKLKGYIEDVILASYKKAGLKVKIKTVPTARLTHLEEK